MDTPHSPFITFVKQRHKADCGVATLAMICGVDYETALLAIGKKQVLAEGVQLRVVRAAAPKLGKHLVLHRTIDPDNDTGILGVVSETWDLEHLVILKEGIVIDAQDQTIWDFDSYMLAHKARAVSLLALREDE
jgi:hypothetical protein